MKTHIRKTLFCCMLICCGIGNNFAQTFCLQMTEVSNDGMDLVVKVEMQAIGPFNLADANLVFSYDGNSLGVPEFSSSPLEPPIYFVPTVSTPAPETGSVNIVLPIVDFGIEVANSPNWLEIVQISFAIIDDTAIGPISWDYNGGTNQTVVFADDPTFPYQIFANDAACLSGYTPAVIEGCTDINACNFNPDATINDGTCFLIGDLCDDSDANTIDDIIDLDCVCVGMPVNTCATDFNGDGITNGEDFIVFLGNFGIECTVVSCPTDLNGNGTTNGEDFIIFLGNFGIVCD